jgi:hypothetical protein
MRPIARLRGTRPELPRTRLGSVLMDPVERESSGHGLRPGVPWGISVVGLGLTTGSGFAASAKRIVTPSIAVTPSTGLTNGETIKVMAQVINPDSHRTVYECNSAFATDGLNACGPKKRRHSDRAAAHGFDLVRPVAYVSETVSATGSCAMPGQFPEPADVGVSLSGCWTGCHADSRLT